MDHLDFRQARGALLNGEASCAQLVSFFLDRISERNGELNAFLSVWPERALADAAKIDERVRAGENLPLAGMVLAVKDLICMKGQTVTCGSRMLRDFESLFDATAIARLREAGAVFLGKTNCDEFGMGSSNENSHFGPARNPHDITRTPGGSSGGSAAAVAAGLCHAALGTDTGGSIRQPASFCGIAGLKPTYGRVSRYGLVAYASSFDVIGPMARDVPTLAALLEVMAGHDEQDSTSAEVAVPPYREAMAGDVAGLRIGIPEDFFGPGLGAETGQLVRKAISKLESGGAEIVPITLPHTRYGIATYYVLTMAEASSNLARYDGARYGYRADAATASRREAAHRQAWTLRLEQAEAAGDDEQAADAREAMAVDRSPLESMYTHTRSEAFGKEVQRRIMLGTYVLSSGYYDAYYGRAQRVRTLIRRDFEAAFERVDLIATPAAPTTAFELGSMQDDPLAMYLSDVYTVTANLAGIPGLSVPVGESAGGLPIGLQLLAPWFEETRLLRAGATVAGAAFTAG